MLLDWQSTSRQASTGSNTTMEPEGQSCTNSAEKSTSTTRSVEKYDLDNR